MSQMFGGANPKHLFPVWDICVVPREVGRDTLFREGNAGVGERDGENEGTGDDAHDG